MSDGWADIRQKQLWDKIDLLNQKIVNLEGEMDALCDTIINIQANSDLIVRYIRALRVSMEENKNGNQTRS